LAISPDKDPDILMPATITNTRDIERESLLVEVDNGRQVLTKILPAL
jgi:hypothetical protein